MPGRIETYIHSDGTTQDKGGAMVEVTCQTDFVAKTPEFIAFAKKVAKMAYATSGNVAQYQQEMAKVTWKDIVELFPDLENDRLALSSEIKESIDLKQAIVLALNSHWSVFEDVDGYV